MSKIRVTGLASANESNVIYIPTGNTLVSPGRVLQVQQGVFKDTFSTTIGPNFTKITGFSCNITPKFTSSKILINLSLCYSQSYYQTRVRLIRNNSVVTDATGNISGVRERVWLNSVYFDAASGPNQYMLAYMTGMFLDSPNSINEQIYEIEIGGYSTGHTVYVNRNQAYPNAAEYDATPISTLTVTEIAQ